MSTIENLLNNWEGYIIGFFAVIFCLREIFNVKDWFCNRFGIKTTGSIKQEKTDKTLEQHSEKLIEVDALHKDVLNIQEQLLLHSEKLDELDVMKNKIASIEDKVDIQTEMLTEMNRVSNASELARLKDRLTQAYNYYKGRAEETGVMEWNELEKDAFDDMYTDYTSRGGNHFVKDTAKPYMDGFTVIKITRE